MTVLAVSRGASTDPWSNSDKGGVSVNVNVNNLMCGAAQEIMLSCLGSAGHLLISLCNTGPKGNNCETAFCKHHYIGLDCVC